MNNIQLVIPMAGDGTRFSNAGYGVSKPLLPIGQARMFEVVLGNLMSERVERVVLIAKKGFNLRSEIENLSRIAPFRVELIEIDETTEGPASTVNLAKYSLDQTKPLVVANSDQYLDYSFEHFYSVLGTRVGGAVVTMEDSDPKWSYAIENDQGEIVGVIEKKVVSKYATAGIYGYREARFFFESLERMQLAKDRTNGEFYVGPTYNYFEPAYGAVVNISMGPVGEVMYGLGIPEDYENFLDSPLAAVAESNALNVRNA